MKTNKKQQKQNKTKKQIFMNKPVYLSLSILKSNVSVLVWLSETKTWRRNKSMLYGYRQLYIKTEDIYLDIAKNVEIRFGISNCELERLLPTGKNQKVIGLMKDEWDSK